MTDVEKQDIIKEIIYRITKDFEKFKSIDNNRKEIYEDIFLVKDNYLPIQVYSGIYRCYKCEDNFLIYELNEYNKFCVLSINKLERISKLKQIFTNDRY